MLVVFGDQHFRILCVLTVYCLGMGVFAWVCACVSVEPLCNGVSPSVDSGNWVGAIGGGTDGSSCNSYRTNGVNSC